MIFLCSCQQTACTGDWSNGMTGVSKTLSGSSILSSPVVKALETHPIVVSRAIIFPEMQSAVSLNHEGQVLEMKRIRGLFLLLLLVCMIPGCEKQEKMDLASIDLTDIEKIEHTGTTGGKDGDFKYFLTDAECSELIGLLHQVKLGSEADESKALSSGAVSDYTLYFTDGDTVTLRPGQFFKIEDTYYDFENYDELWDEFVKVGSAHQK